MACRIVGSPGMVGGQESNTPLEALRQAQRGGSDEIVRELRPHVNVSRPGAVGRTWVAVCHRVAGGYPTKVGDWRHGRERTGQDLPPAPSPCIVV